MSSSLVHAKAALRREIRAWLRARTPAERAQASRAAGAVLRARPEWQAARSVLGYVARPDELDLEPVWIELVARGGRLALPRWDPATGAYQAAWVPDPAKDLRPGRYGIAEPAPACPPAHLNQLDLLLVPGLCFAPNGRRLGRGQGYFDRLLAAEHGPAWGVAWDEQIREDLPAGPEDQQVDGLVTPTRWLAVTRR